MCFPGFGCFWFRAFLVSGVPGLGVPSISGTGNANCEKRMRNIILSLNKIGTVVNDDAFFSFLFVFMFRIFVK